MQRVYPTAATRVTGVIGDPVEHSLSPDMHNAAFAALGLNYVYAAWRIRLEDLATAVRGMRALGFAGFNVTIPHKVAVIPLLDELTAEAKLIGAVNTVVWRGDRMVGHNTDAEGFLNSLAEAGCAPRGLSAVLLGAGGAARSVAFALARAGVSRLTIINRSVDKASGLARGVVAAGFATRLGVLGLDEPGVSDEIRRAGLVVNATSVGLGGRDLPVPPESLRAGQYVTDLVYNPLLTPLLAAAAERGCRTVFGDGMLIHQGALAFTMWTGERAPLKEMREALSARLGG